MVDVQVLVDKKVVVDGGWWMVDGGWWIFLDELSFVFEKRLQTLITERKAFTVLILLFPRISQYQKSADTFPTIFSNKTITHH